jgi:AcrR family transcriptional regulator
VSLGEVAAEAGISKGLVQHYFTTKDAMLRFAAGTLRDQVEDRLDAPATLRDTVVALLPIDEASRTEALVANAFLVRALKDEEMADRFRTGHAQLAEVLTAMVAAAQAEGELTADLDPAREADLVLAVVTGLSDAVLLGHRTPEQAIALVDHHLSRLEARETGLARAIE